MAAGSYAQLPPRSDFDRARELFEAKQYLAAQKELADLAGHGISDRHAEQAAYMEAICAAKVAPQDAAPMLESFLVDYPNSLYGNDIKFALACAVYGTGDGKQNATDLFLAVNPFELGKEQQDEYYFKLGHSRFLSGDRDAAYADLRNVGAGSGWGNDATYLISYIDYERGNYSAAKRGFEALAGDAVYKKIVPFYLLHIAYLQGDYGYVVQNGDALMAASTPVRAEEIARIIAASYFHQKNFAMVPRYLNDSSGRPKPDLSREEKYMLGFSLMDQAYWAEAAPLLEAAAGSDDELGQNASYHLAYCQLRLGNKQMARQSFMLAAGADYNAAVKEDALFNYAKLQYDMVGSDFVDAITVLKRYLTEYPASSKTDEIRELLISAYYNSRNYPEAYQAIMEYPNPDNNIRAALQRISYFRALELYQSGDYAGAEKMLQQSASNRYNAKYTALAAYWRGQALCRMGDYKAAAPLFREYQRLSPAAERENVISDYDLGYCAFNEQSWADARTYYSRFLDRYKTMDDLRADTYNRLGDISFATRGYAKAIDNYDIAIRSNTPSRYYAQYQKAVMLGLSDKTPAKIEALKSIIAKNEGDYVAASMYELGQTYLGSENYSAATDILRRYTETYPNDVHYADALNDLGLAYQNLGDNAKALSYFKRVVALAPASGQSRQAMGAIQSVYVEMNDVNAYFDYAKTTGVETDLSTVRRDSLTYASAYKLYLSNDKAKAAAALDAYLKDFSKGNYRAAALYYAADTKRRSGNQAGAIANLEELSGIYANEFTVPGLEKLAGAYFEQGKWLPAAENYRRLYKASANPVQIAKAQENYLAAAEKSGQQELVIAAAEELLALPAKDANVLRRARYDKARHLESAGQKAEAALLWQQLSSEPATVEGAEATYRMIAAAPAADLQKKVQAFAATNTPQRYWLAKAFMLLGDHYAALNDGFQARATYQSILDGYNVESDGIRDEAKDKIKNLK